MRSFYTQIKSETSIIETMLGTKILEERKSSINGKIRVVKDLAWGVHIQAEGLTQSGGVVEDIWRSTLRKISHYPLTISHCLILGLGGGTAAKLVRKFWPASRGELKAKITGVDIDPIMIELGNRHLGLGNSKVDIVIEDASRFCELCTTRYELIIVDLYKGYEYPKKFESERFLKSVRRLLFNGKLAVFNRLYIGEARPEAMKFGKKLEKVFPKVEYFHPEANLMLLCYNR